MKLTVLGSGGIFPDPQRGGPAYLLTHQDHHLLLDAGPGALRALVKSRVSLDDLDGVCITHQHADHTGELFLLLDLERYRWTPPEHRADRGSPVRRKKKTPGRRR